MKPFTPLVLALLGSLPAAQGLLIPLTNSRDLVYDPARRILYASTASGRVERYDAVSDTLLAPLVGGTLLNGLDLTPDLRALYVAEGEAVGSTGFVHRFDLETGRLTTLSFFLEDAPFETAVWDVVIGNAGKALVATRECQFCSGWVPLRELDLATGVITRRFDIQNADIRGRSSIERGADRSRILIAEGNSSGGSLFSYACGSDTFSTELNLNEFLGSNNSVNRDGTLFALEAFPGVHLVRSNLTTLPTLSARSAPLFDPVRDRLYVLDLVSDEIVILETVGFTELGRLAVGEDLTGSGGLPGNELVIGPAGDFLFLRTPSGLRKYEVGPVAPAVRTVAPGRAAFDAPAVQATIGGRFFGAGTRVFFGASEAGDVQVLDDATLTCTVPPGSPGPVDVRVVNAAGEETLRDGFVYTPGIRTRGVAEIGERLWIDYEMAPFSAVVALYGVPPAVSRPTPYGPLCLSAPIRMFALQPTFAETFTLVVDIPVSPSLLGTSLLLQAWIGPSPAQARFTNCRRIDIH